MRKISLDLDALQVDSFATVATDAGARGTIRGHATEMTVCVGLCGGYGETEIASCACPTDAGCVYPTAVYHSCADTETYGEHSCYCLYPNTDARMCCTEEGCSGGGMC